MMIRIFKIILKKMMSRWCSKAGCRTGMMWLSFTVLLLRNVLKLNNYSRLMKRMLRAMMMLPIVGQVDSLLQLDNFIRAQDSPTYTILQLHLFSPCSLSLSSFCLPFFSSVTCHSACAWLIIYLCALLLLLFFVSLSFGGRRGRQKWQAYKARAGCLAQRELKCHPE